jgi:hypothetical protein
MYLDFILPKPPVRKNAGLRYLLSERTRYPQLNVHGRGRFLLACWVCVCRVRSRDYQLCFETGYNVGSRGGLWYRAARARKPS